MITRHCIKTALLICLLTISASGQAVRAAKNSAPVVREHILVQLENAQKLTESKQPEKSLALLIELSQANLSHYELSQVYQLLAFQSYQSNNPKKAIEYYQKLLGLDGLPDITRKQNQYNLSQIFFAIEAYQSALETINQWFYKNDNVDAAAYELLAQIHYYLKNYKTSINAINNAIRLYRTVSKPPRQNWLQLLQTMHYQLKDLPSSILASKQLVRFYPKKAYWLQLANLYAEIDDSKNQLSVLDTVYLQGLLDRESELKMLAYLLLGQNSPFKAARVLQQGLKDGQIESTEKNLILVANAWQQARELGRAIEFYQMAANISNDGNLHARLAQLYLVDEQFQQASKASRIAIEKGSLKLPGAAYNTLGVSLYRQRQFRAALDAFRNAEKDASAVSFALQWRQHIENIFEGEF